MSAIRAIVADTWQQSRQQAVFIILLVILALVAIATIVVPKPYTDADGVKRVGLIWEDQPSQVLETAWSQRYAMTLLVQSDEPLDIRNEEQVKERVEAAAKAAEAETNTPADQRAVEMILLQAAAIIFSLSMLLFIGASSGYFPNMLESGGVDIVLAKPLRRSQIYLGKYLGGLGLFAAAIAVTYVVMFLGVGIRTGVWKASLFLVMPLQIFTAAVLYSILAAVGTLTRNSTLCVILGYVFYILVDSVVSVIISLGQAGILGSASDVVAGLRWVLPNFGLLKDTACSSVLNMPVLQWESFVPAAGWLALMLTVGIWKFKRTDY